MEIVTGGAKYEITKKDLLFDGDEYAIFQKAFDDKTLITIKINESDFMDLNISKVGL